MLKIVKHLSELKSTMENWLVIIKLDKHKVWMESFKIIFYLGLLWAVSTELFIGMVVPILGRFSELLLILYGVLIYWVVLKIASVGNLIFDSRMNDIYMNVFAQNDKEPNTYYEFISEDTVSQGLLIKLMGQDHTQSNDLPKFKVEFNRIFEIKDILIKELDNDMLKMKLFRNYLEFRMTNNVSKKLISYISNGLISIVSAGTFAKLIEVIMGNALNDFPISIGSINIIDIFLYLSFALAFFNFLSRCIFHITKPIRVVKYLISVMDILIDQKSQIQT